MSDEELTEIEQRCLLAQPQQEGTLSFNALLESARDVPTLAVEVRRLRGHLEAIGGIFEELRCSLDKRESEIARTALRITWQLNNELVRALPPAPTVEPAVLAP